jgi:hypothetical protein
MNQSLYANMNNKRKMKKKKDGFWRGCRDVEDWGEVWEEVSERGTSGGRVRGMQIVAYAGFIGHELAGQSG